VIRSLLVTLACAFVLWSGARGYRFVTLDEALKGDAYRTPDGYVGRFGPSWLHRWRIALGKPDRLRDEGDPPAWVVETFNRIQGGHP
jgi:hypothetical protein